MNTPTEIIRIRETDIKPIFEILTNNNLESWSYNDLIAEIQRDDSIALVAIIQFEVIGFCMARLINIKLQSNAIYSENNNITECEIYNIAVKKKYQGQGIGKKMLDEVILIAKMNKSQAVWLEVRDSNFKAKNFYRVNSFEQVYERKNFYSNPPEKAIVMKRNL
jgi:ribosomal-protein-alanine N-acetyltransferase